MHYIFRAIPKPLGLYVFSLGTDFTESVAGRGRDARDTEKTQGRPPPPEALRGWPRHGGILHG